MKCDDLRASRIFDSMISRLKCPETERSTFMEFMRSDGPSLQIWCGLGCMITFVKSDGLWAVGFNHRALILKDDWLEVWKAIRDMNGQLQSYTHAHLLSGAPEK